VSETGVRDEKGDLGLSRVSEHASDGEERWWDDDVVGGQQVIREPHHTTPHTHTARW
jgi:hypothetical protein